METNTKLRKVVGQATNNGKKYACGKLFVERPTTAEKKCVWKVAGQSAGSCGATNKQTGADFFPPLLVA